MEDRGINSAGVRARRGDVTRPNVNSNVDDNKDDDDDVDYEGSQNGKGTAWGMWQGRLSRGVRRWRWFAAADDDGKSWRTTPRGIVF